MTTTTTCPASGHDPSTARCACSRVSVPWLAEGVSLSANGHLGRRSLAKPRTRCPFSLVRATLVAVTPAAERLARRRVERPVVSDVMDGEPFGGAAASAPAAIPLDHLSAHPPPLGRSPESDLRPLVSPRVRLPPVPRRALRAPRLARRHRRTTRDTQSQQRQRDAP